MPPFDSPIQRIAWGSGPLRASLTAMVYAAEDENDCWYVHCDACELMIARDLTSEQAANTFADLHNRYTHNEKERAMRSTATIARDIERTTKRLDELNKELDTALAMPSQPEIGSTIRFTVRYDPGEKEYVYVGLRASTGWFVTGASGGHDWDWVVDLMRKDYRIADGGERVKWTLLGPVLTITAPEAG